MKRLTILTILQENKSSLKFRCTDQNPDMKPKSYRISMCLRSLQWFYPNTKLSFKANLHLPRKNKTKSTHALNRRVAELVLIWITKLTVLFKLCR